MILFSPEIYGCIDHDPLHPAHQNDLYPLPIPYFKTAETAKHLYETIIGQFYSLFIQVYIPKNRFKAESIVFFIQQMLAFAILITTSGNNLKQFFQANQIVQCEGYFIENDLLKQGVA